LRDVLAPTWSVSVEEWFYFLWAPVVLIFRRTGLAVTILVCIVVSLAFRWLGSESGWAGNFFCRLDSLAIGAVLALFIRYRRTFYSARVAACILLLALLYYISPFLNRDIRCSVMFATFGPIFISLASAAALALILQYAGSSALFCHVLRYKSLVFIGRRSYMIYLVHLPAIGL
jgi:peptidoglycan/LPS O-acetylase OafA/YrhL